jgi:hypothetical protein
VEHGGDADPGTQMLRVGGDCQHGLGRDLEQEIVDHGLVLVGDVGDRRRQREHHVIVRHRQQLGLAVGEPFLRGGALALRAMAVAAGIVGDTRIGAVLTACDMTTEGCRPMRPLPTNENPAIVCAKRQQNLYSITSSARMSRAGGMLRPSAFAVLRFIASRNVVGDCTGKSAGNAPFRIRST